MRWRYQRFLDSESLLYERVSGAIEDSLFMIDTQICVMQTCIINDNL
ncbi:hypothetical protein [uncultured Helicobacter sp.]